LHGARGLLFDVSAISLRTARDKGGSALDDRPNLSDAEWALVRELLRAAQRQLPAEIRHTTRANIRQELHERQRTISRIIEQPESAHVS
jgi:hypothetical protein